jgi:hypothetical protein
VTGGRKKEENAAVKKGEILPASPFTRIITQKSTA